MTDPETDDADLPDDEPLPRAGRTNSVLGLVIDGFFGILEGLSALLGLLAHLLH